MPNGWFQLEKGRHTPLPAESAPPPERPPMPQLPTEPEPCPEPQPEPAPQPVPEPEPTPQPVPIPEPEPPERPLMPTPERQERPERPPVPMPPPERPPLPNFPSTPPEERPPMPAPPTEQPPVPPAECPPVPTPPVEMPSPLPPVAPVPPIAPTPPPAQPAVPLAHSQTVGPDGPVLLQDTRLHETLAQFVWSPPNPRVVHTKGYGAFGNFFPYRSMADYTTLSFLQTPQAVTEVTCRFSLAVSDGSTPDTVRNVRGFSTKFDAENGTFDLLCNQIPVFAVRDAMNFPAFINSLKPDPNTGLTDPAALWAFAARAPEATAFLLWFFSDVGTAADPTRLRYYGVDTFVWVNAEGKRHFVKYHWLPLLGEAALTAEEAARLACTDPDIGGRTLYGQVTNDAPAFELNVQLMEPDDAAALPFDPLDATKVWPLPDYPLLPVGVFTLKRVPDDARAQIDPLAFSPANLLPGAELSADKLLQGRANLYWDAQRRRLGPNFRSLPPNRQVYWSPERLVTSGEGEMLSGPAVRAPITKQDDFTQAGEFWRALSPEEKGRLAANLGVALRDAADADRMTVLGYLRRADPGLAEAVGRQPMPLANQAAGR